MNYVTLIIGVLGILFGLYTLYARMNDPTKLGKLNAMKEKMGHGAGNVVHLIAYTVLPVLFGCMLIYRGVNGASLFG